MRIPTYQSRRGLDTGASSLRTPRANTSVGSALRSLGGQLSALGRQYAQQQEAALNLQARRGFIEFNNAVQSGYQETVNNAPEDGSGLWDSWFTDTDEQPGFFNQAAEAYLSQLDPERRAEYEVRIEEIRGRYDRQLAADQLEFSRAFATDVITQQVDASALAITQDPDLLESHLTDIASLIQSSGLNSAQQGAQQRAAANTLALAAIGSQAQSNPSAIMERIDNHMRALETQRVSPVGDNNQQLVSAVLDVEQRLGIPAQDLLSIFSFETGGSLDPWQRGPTTQWGQHRGLIQWGEPQRRQYGVSQGSTVAEQVNAAAQYLFDRGYEVGMPLENMYAAVLAGDANRTGVGDLHNGGVSRGAAHSVATQFGGHIDRARALLEEHGGVVQEFATSVVNPSDGSAPDPVLQFLNTDQILNIRADAANLVAERARASDYDVAVMEQAAQDNIRSIRETGRPIEDVTDDRVLAALGEDEFFDYQQQRRAAEIFHTQTDGMDMMSADEIEARIEEVRLRDQEGEEGGQLGYGETAEVRAEIRDYAENLLRERTADPAQAAFRVPELRQAWDQLREGEFRDPEAMTAFVTDSLRWQGTMGIPFEERRPIPNTMARALANEIQFNQRAMTRAGSTPMEAMEATYGTIAAIYGDRYAEEITRQALEQINGGEALSEIAMQVFRRARIGQSPTREQLNDVEEAIDQQSLDQGLEAFPQEPSLPQ